MCTVLVVVAAWRGGWIDEDDLSRVRVVDEAAV